VVKTILLSQFNAQRLEMLPFSAGWATGKATGL